MADEDYYINDLANAGVPDPTRPMLPQRDDSIQPTMILPRRDDIPVETEGAPRAMPVPYDVFENDPQSMAAFDGSSMMADAGTTSPAIVKEEEPPIAPQEPVLIDTVPDEPEPEPEPVQELPELAGPPIEAMQERRRGQDLDKVFQIAIDPQPFQQEHGISEKRVQGAVNTAFLNTLMGSDISGDPSDMGRQAAIRLVGQQMFPGQNVKDEDSLFAAVQGKAIQRRDESELLKSIQQYSRKSAIAGEVGGLAMQGDWEAIKQMPGYDPAKTADYIRASRIWEEQAANAIRPYLPTIGAIIGEADMGGTFEEIGPAEITSWSEEQWQGILQAFHIVAQGMTEENRESWLKGAGKSAKRAGTDIIYGSVRFGVSKAMQLDAIKEAGLAQIAGLGADQPKLEEAFKTVEDFEVYIDRLGDLNEIFRGEYDPIEKSGKWYVDLPQEIPSMTASMALMYGNPFALIGGTTELVRNSLYQNARAQGFTEEQSRQYRNIVTPAVAAPVVLLEKLKLDTATGKIPGYNKLLVSISNKFSNKYIRGGARAITTTAIEAGQEVTQDIADTTVREIASWFGEEMATVEWTDEMVENALRYPEYFVGMLAVGSLSMVGGAHLDQAAEALKQDLKTDPKTRVRMIMGGASSADLDVLEKAEGMGDTNEAFQNMMNNLDPQSDEAKEVIKQVKKAQEFLDRIDAAEAEVRDGRLPNFEINENGWTVTEANTGNVIAEGLTQEQAMDVAKESFMVVQAFDDAMTAELASILMAQEAIMQKGGRAEISLESKGALEWAKEQGPEQEKRFWLQVERMKQQDPDYDIEKAALLPVFGVNYLEDKGAGKGKQVVTKIMGGGRGIMTVFHEEAHGYLRTAIDNKTMSWKGVYEFFRDLDKGLKGLPENYDQLSEKDKERARSKVVKFLPDDFGELVDGVPTEKQMTALDEAVAELMEVEILRTRKRGGMKSNLEADKIREGLLASMKLRAREAAAYGDPKAKAARGLGKILFAARHFWKQIFSRLTQIRAGIASGDISEADIEKFTNTLFGLDEQAEFDKRVDQESMSLGPPSADTTPRPGEETEGPDGIPEVVTPDRSTVPGTLAPSTPAREVVPDDDSPDIPWDDSKYSLGPKVLPEAFPMMNKELADQMLAETDTLGAIHIDRAGVGEIDGVPIQGGAMYPAIVENLKAGIAWAFNSIGVAKDVLRRARAAGGYIKLILMAEGNVVGNKTFATIWLNRMEEITKDKEQKKIFIEELHKAREAAIKSKITKVRRQERIDMDKGKEVSPREENAIAVYHRKGANIKTFKQAKKFLLNMSQTDRASFYFQRGTLGKATKELPKGTTTYGKLLGKKLAQKQGWPDAYELVEQFEDPAFKGMRTGDVVGIIKLDPDSKIMTAAEAGVPEHLSYGYVVMGKPFARMTKIRNVEKDYPKMKGQLMAQGAKQYPATDYASFSIGPVGNNRAITYFSKMEQVIGQKLQGKTATPQQIMAVIDPQKGSGVKAEEIKWSGIEQKVQSMAKDGKVNVQELRDWINAEGMVKLEEVTLGSLKGAANRQRELILQLNQLGYSMRTGMDGEIQILDLESGEIQDFEDLPMEAINVLEELESLPSLTETEADGVKYSQYTLPGGENYQEVVLTMAISKSAYEAKVRSMSQDQLAAETMRVSGMEMERGLGRVANIDFILLHDNRSVLGKPVYYESSHFPKVGNYIAHMRMNERNGGLFIEEIQSDRHQAGRKKGYKPEMTPELKAQIESVEKRISAAGGTPGDAAGQEYRRLIEESDRLRGRGAIPDAPFRKDWHLAMFKRALGHAVARGMDWIGWTSGQTQADRYDLSKQVESISVIDHVDGGRFLSVVDKAGLPVLDVKYDADGKTDDGKELSDVVGKELAEKILAIPEGQRAQSSGYLVQKFEGLDLQVGGEGMKGFYDKMLPTAVQKYVKQWGAKVVQADIDTERGPSTELRIDTSDINGKLYVFEGNGGDVAGPFNTREQAQKWIDDEAAKSIPIWKVEITPKMRENIEQVGQPSFSIGPVTPQMDADYMAAVEAGDMDSAQRMVDEAAKKAGYDIGPVWHGTTAEFTKFDRNTVGQKDSGMLGEGFYFSTNEETASWYGNMATFPKNFFDQDFRNKSPFFSRGKSRIGRFFLRGNILNVPEKRFYEEATDKLMAMAKVLGLDPETATSKQVSNEAVAQGYDGAQITFGDKSSSMRAAQRQTETVVYNPSQIKSADPVTYDDAGNVIPLSERFNEQSQDIRYSIANMAATYVPETEQEVEAANKAKSNKQKARSPILAIAAVRLANGEITVEDYADAVDVIDPFVSKGVETPPTEDEIRKYISSSKKAKVGVEIEPGTPVEARIDIPTWNKSTAAGNSVYAVTLHKPVAKTAKQVGTPLSYMPMAHLKNVEMMTRAISGQGGAIRIAAGQGKTPLATVAGEVVSTSVIPKDISEYAEVSYNPIRSSGFRDVTNRRVVMGGDEAVSIGSRVYVKNPRYGEEPTGFIDALTPEADIRYSLGPVAMAGSLADAARRRMMKSPEYQMAFFDNLMKRLQAIQAFIETRGTAYNFDAFGKEFEGKFTDEKEGLLNALAMLEAIQKSLPPDLRGRLGGGALSLAKQDTDEKRLEYLKGRVKAATKVVEQWTNREMDKALDKLFKREKVTKNKAGKKPGGKAGAEIHDIFKELREYKDKGQDDVDERVDGLNAQLEGKGYESIELEAAARVKMNLIGLIGNWKEATVSRKIQAVKEATKAFEAGYYTYQLQKLMEKEDRDIKREDLRKATGKEGHGAERDEQEIKDQGLVGKGKQLMLDLLSFEDLLGFIFGKDHWIVLRWTDLERKASDFKEDFVQNRMDALDNLFTELAGGDKFKGEKLRWKMSSQKTIKVNGRQLTEFEALSATMMWMQDDGRRHMEGPKDDDGNPVEGKWNYTQEFVDAIEAKLPDEAKAVRAHLMETYGKEWAQINPTFKKLNGINLPSNALYSPITVKPQQAGADQMLDPTTGFAMSKGSATPPSLRTRGVAIAEPDFRDVVKTYISHTTQIGHYLAYAPMLKEISPIIRNRDLTNSVDASAGEQARVVLQKWEQYFHQGGVVDAAAQMAVQQLLGRMVGRAAGAILIGRISVIMIQSTQLFASMAEMPIGSFLYRFSKLMTGNLGWGKAFKSEYIQRRLKEMPVSVREAMKGLEASKPNRLKYWVQKAGRSIAGMDALMTAGTYAIVYDYKLKEAKNNGLEGAEAEAYAVQSAERSVDRIAQPTRPGARSIFENNVTNPIARVGWAFASEARQKLALGLYRAGSKQRTLGEKGRALAVTFLIGGTFATIIRNFWRDLKDGEDDEVFDSKHWDPTRLILASVTGPLQGVPFLGSAIETGIWRATGEYMPEGDMLSAIPDAIEAAMDIGEFAEQDIESTMKDVETILSGGALLNDTFAAAASVSHLVRDLYRAINANLPD